VSAPTLVLASQNAKKAAELSALLAPLGYTLRPLSDWTAHAPEETAPSFVENALIKARHAAALTGLPAIADDSGLEVAALAGAPGVLSARYAGEPSDDAANNRKLLAALAEVPVGQRQARFVCALVYLRHAADPVPIIALGTWPGEILKAPRGVGGFGYDPLFGVPGLGKTAAELSAAEKARLSHRGRALRSLLRQLQGRA
jgi:XTP/dITP diphosphohydrolase